MSVVGFCRRRRRVIRIATRIAACFRFLFGCVAHDYYVFSPLSLSLLEAYRKEIKGHYFIFRRVQTRRRYDVKAIFFAPRRKSRNGLRTVTNSPFGRLAVCQ